VTTLVTVVLIVLHTLDNRPVRINPSQIVQVVQPKPEGTPNKQMHDAVSCVIRFTDGSYVSVIESCDDVRRIVESVK
jgi:hypothetical protein